MSKIKAGKKAAESVSQYFSKLLGRPVGLNESATKVQEEAIKKQKMKNKNKFLTGGQAKLDKNKNDRIDAEDFKGPKPAKEGMFAEIDGHSVMGSSVQGDFGVNPSAIEYNKDYLK